MYSIKKIFCLCIPTNGELSNRLLHSLMALSVVPYLWILEWEQSIFKKMTQINRAFLKKSAWFKKISLKVRWQVKSDVILATVRPEGDPLSSFADSFHSFVWVHILSKMCNDKWNEKKRCVLVRQKIFLLKPVQNNKLSF